VVELSVLHGLCGKRKEDQRTKWIRIFLTAVKTRVEKKAAVVTSRSCSQEYNLQSSKTENRAD